MKKSKKIISLLLTIQMLLACALIPSAIATDSVIEEPIDVVEALVIDEGEGSEELSPMIATRCLVFYRYGSSYEPTDADMPTIDGYVMLNSGVSVNTNPGIKSLINRYGPAQRVNYIPNGLQFYYTGGTHYVIAPSYRMTPDEYRALCGLIW